MSDLTTATPAEWARSLDAAPRTQEMYLFFRRYFPTDSASREANRIRLEGFLHSLPINEYVGLPWNPNTRVPPFPWTRRW